MKAQISRTLVLRSPLELYKILRNKEELQSNLYGTERVIILGAKRSVGKTKGTFFNPIYKKKKND